jgi:hypothetical protein
VLELGGHRNFGHSGAQNPQHVVEQAAAAEGGFAHYGKLFGVFDKAQRLDEWL